jgi:putative ABC transport system permease protein
VSAELAAAKVRDFGEQVRREVAPTATDWSLQLFESRRVRFPFDPRGQIVPGRLAAAVLCVSGIVLLIAAANLAGTLLAKGVARKSELALRLTLGATRGRIVRQLVAESLLLSAAGAALGLICARWLIDLFIAATPSRFVRWQISTLVLDVPIDWRVVLFTSLSSLVTGLVVGLAPARQVLKVDLVAGLAGQSVSATTAVKATLQRWIVVPQICLALVLLLLAGVTARTLIRDHARHPGYDAGDVILIDFETPDRPAPLVWTKESADRVRTERLARLERVLDRARAAPGIRDVTVGMTSPLMSVPLPSMNAWVAAREGFRSDGRHYWTSRMDVTPGYFGTLRIPLLRGRLFDAGDRRNAPAVAIVSEDLARWMWPDADPIGQYLAHHTPDSSYPPQWLEVVGVVGNVHLPLADANWSPTFYTPMEQGIMDFASTVAARGDGAATDLLRTLEAAITSADPQAVPVNQRLMRDGIGELLYPRRVAAMTLALAGAIGLVLASTGLYGLISYSVAQRVREIGVRMALGADRGDVLRLIFREGLILSGAGIGLGFPLTFAAIRIFSRLVAPLPSMDLVTFCAVPTLLGVVVVVACYIPALRAARVDPMDVLRGL